MNNLIFDFYSPTSLKSYNLDKNMQYQLNILGCLDVFTRKHSENVANITCRLCERLHCSKGFTEYCTICAYLHDIGKQFIPSNILQKPDKLTDEEYEIMKTHTTIGYEICMKDSKLQPYSAGPLYHHEALNGTGYPQKLTKKDIPYEGQIIRVADEYDAIVSKRQYKSHIGISDTLKILIKNANSGKNNPIIVKVLCNVVIEDIEYEISCLTNYTKSLTKNIKRLNIINKYKEKMEKAKSEKKKNYYLEGMKAYLDKNESIENYQKILNEYTTTFENKNKQIKHLLEEIKIIKKLKI